MPVTPLRFDTESGTGRVLLTDVTAVLADRLEADELAARYGETVDWSVSTADEWPEREKTDAVAGAFGDMHSARAKLAEAIAEYRRRGGSEETVRECLEGLLWLVERHRPGNQTA